MQATRHPHAINVITNHKIVSNLSYHSSCNFNGVPLSLSLYSFLEDDEQKLIRHTRKASHPPSSSLFSLFPPFSPKRPHPFLFNRFFDFFINWFSNLRFLVHLAKANLLVLRSIPRAVLFGAELGFQICR